MNSFPCKLTGDEAFALTSRTDWHSDEWLETQVEAPDDNVVKQVIRRGLMMVRREDIGRGFPPVVWFKMTKRGLKMLQRYLA